MMSSTWSVSAFFTALILLAGCAAKEPATPEGSRGAVVYAEYCLRCHGANGEGNSEAPDIRARNLWENNSDTLLFILAFGMATDYTTDSVARKMPPVPYSDADLAEVAAYVSAHIGKTDNTYTEADVIRVRAAHKADVQERLNRPNSDQ